MTSIKSHFHFLGTGGSMGIPVIGCTCPVCLSGSPHNIRMRPSALIHAAGRRILIDCGPDFKEQALKHNINTLDGIIFTHAHHDHTAGLDELRIYTLRSHQALPCLLSSESAKAIRNRFNYMFDESDPYASLTAKFDLQLLEEERGVTIFQGLKIRYFSYEQGKMRVDGFRFGNLAYVTDIRHYPETIFEDLQDVNTLILSALRFSPSALHFSVDEAIDFARRVGAKETWFMHIAHDLDHEKTNAYLPMGMRLAHDGLQLEFSPDMIK